jgi:hypothetical protein
MSRHTRAARPPATGPIGALPGGFERAWGSRGLSQRAALPRVAGELRDRGSLGCRHFGGGAPLRSRPQARNHPLARLAVTRVPSRSRSVTPVTPGPVRPTSCEKCWEPSFGGVALLPEETRDMCPAGTGGGGWGPKLPPSEARIGWRPEKHDNSAAPCMAFACAIARDDQGQGAHRHTTVSHCATEQT